MGFWDVRIADLEAVGEYFTDTEIEVLEEGGRVLHLHPLETPDYETRDWCVYPDTMEIVVMPEVLDTYGPREPLPAEFENSHGGPFFSAAAYLDHNHAYRGDRSTWTDIPRYIGTTSCTCQGHFACDMRCEEVIGFAYWNCIPIVGEHDELAVKQILHAAQRVFDDALWPQMEWLCRMAYEGEYDWADPWLFVNHQDRWLKQAPEDLEAFFNAFTYNYGSYAEEQMRCEAEMFEDLYNARLVDVECKGFEDLAHGENWKEMPFVRLEDLLWNDGEYDAHAFYMKVLAKRQYALDRRPRITNYRGISENEVED